MIAFTLPIVPTAQARARHGVVNGHSVTFKSDRQKANEQSLDGLLSRYAPAAPMSGAVALEFIAVFPPPRSASKKAREAMLRGTEPHTKKPDLDNLVKQLKDAMTRLQFWCDDRQVVRISCEKRYGEVGEWRVAVAEATQKGA